MNAQGMYGSGESSGEMPYSNRHGEDVGGRPSEEDILAENERLRQEVKRMGEKQGEVMALLNCKSPDRMVHDLRNLLNELNLYRSLVENDA